MSEVTSRRSGAPYLAFAAPHNHLKRAQRLSPAQAGPSTPNVSGSVTSEAQLAWALADAASVCFTAKDQLGIYTTVGAGENYSAIEQMLDIVVHNRYPLPARLISALAAWLDCYIGSDHESTTRSLLNRVETKGAR